jgi:hypothetical protein
MRFAGNVVIFPWVGWREPTPHVLLQAVTYQTIMVNSGKSSNDKE